MFITEMKKKLMKKEKTTINIYDFYHKFEKSLNWQAPRHTYIFNLQMKRRISFQVSVKLINRIIY